MLSSGQDTVGPGVTLALRPQGAHQPEESRKFARSIPGEHLTVTGFIAYAQGWGGLYIRANKLAWKLIDAHPGVGIKNRYGIPDVPERVHWEEEFALEVGAPGAYDYGPERCSWLMHQLTNWMGDDGFLRRAECKVRRHNPQGDLLFIKGKVKRKFGGVGARTDPAILAFRARWARQSAAPA